MPRSRGQAGLDLIASYGWVVLVGIGGALILSQMGTFNPSQCGKNLLGFSQVVPVDWTVYVGTNIMLVSVQVDNWAGDDLEVDNLSASFEDLSCTGDASVVLEPGNKSTFTLNCTGFKGKSYNHGECYNVHLDINYHNLVSGNYDDSQGKIKGSFEEFVAMTSTTTSTTLAVTTSTSTTTTICALDSQCPFCQKCVSGFCANEGTAEDSKFECPGAFGTCAGPFCNGAGACQYLAAGKWGCGMCQGCTGSSFACAQVAAGSDTYNECPGAFGACAGANCDGAGACQFLAAGKNSCGTCQYCTGVGFGCANMAAGSDTYGDCPGAFGACADSNCDGAGACQYLSGEQSCGVCQTCTGSGYACSLVPLGQDPNNDCAANWDGCSGSCVKTGTDGNCNGAGVCNAGGASANCSANTTCSAGSCVYSGSCGSSGVYCSTHYRFQDSYRCDGGGICSFVSSSTNLQDCGTSYWGSNYQCSGQQPQRQYFTIGCSSGSCTNVSSWQNNGSACTGGENNRCVGGSCVNQCSNGLDDDGDGYTDGQDTDCGGCGQCVSGACCNIATGCFLSGKQSCGTCQQCTGASSSCSFIAAGSDSNNECPGAFGTCAGANCNGAGACQYLAAGKQGCGTCQGCTGSSFACAQVAAGSDTYTECPGAFGTCAGANCNGASACQYLAAGKQGCGTCQGCTGSGFACAQVAAGSDTYNECPGAFGTCAGANCNGASACQYLAAGKQTCATCQYCTGSSFACSSVGAGSDTYGDCSGNCDECNGAGACRANNALCANTVASCTCSGSGNSYSCQSCTNAFGACGYAQCSSYACSNPVYAAGTDCGALCQSCDGSGNCVNTANGLDYQSECPGAFGTCAGLNCNGVGACQYLAAGKQGCATCQVCTGSGFACSVVASGQDPYGDCPGAFGTCAAATCNGASACGYVAAGKGSCATCQYCTGASFACANVANGQDMYNDCPGAFGTCAGANCNGAAACQYLGAGKQGCATCKYCNGASFACSNVGAGTDPYNDCNPVFNGCSGSCIKTGLSGACSGAGACSASSQNVAAGNICSAGSEVAGVCNAAWKCSTAINTDNAYGNSATGQYYTQGICDGAASCDRSGANGNHCTDGVKDCDECGVDCGGSCAACAGCNMRSCAGVAHYAATGVPNGHCNVNGDCLQGICENGLCCPAGYCGLADGINDLCYIVGNGKNYGAANWICTAQATWKYANAESTATTSWCCSGINDNNYCCLANQCGYGTVQTGACYNIGQTSNQGGTIYTCCSQGVWKFGTGATCAIASQCCSGVCSSSKCT